jgi:hypothetical protein
MGGVSEAGRQRRGGKAGEKGGGESHNRKAGIDLHGVSPAALRTPVKGRPEWHQPRRDHDQATDTGTNLHNLRCEVNNQNGAAIIGRKFRHRSKGRCGVAGLHRWMQAG